ncbi:LysE family translocator [Streptomyces sp. SLBN-118]|uniref:LysE family translocator n=1 Tax=Streptomyces sp. SLBN-118 TaxID=2768454 RepID=UPI0037D9DBFC
MPPFLPDFGQDRGRSMASGLGCSFMITVDAIGTFALIVGLLTLTPGLDTALILRTAALGHRRRAWGVVLGIQSGTLVWGTLTSLGATALLTASHLAYETLRWAGAAYLVWMGGRLLWATWRHSSSNSPHTAKAGGPVPGPGPTPGEAPTMSCSAAGGKASRPISSTRRSAPSTLLCSRNSSPPEPRTLLWACSWPVFTSSWPSSAPAR